MRLKTLLLLGLFCVAVLFFSGCISNNDHTSDTGKGLEADLKAELAAREETINRLTAEKETLEAKVEELQGQTTNGRTAGPSASLLLTALETVELLHDRELQGLSQYVHPAKGVRFSPYGYVRLQDDLVFAAGELPGLLQDSRTYIWGSFDGTGDPIDYAFSEYYDRFVYDVDFAEPDMIGNNYVIGTGNTLINLDESYPEGSFVEFYLEGKNPDYGGMDWRSLRLVYEELDGAWYLVGIVHDEWTI